MVPQRRGVGRPTAVFVVLVVTIVGAVGLLSVTSPSEGGAVSSGVSTTSEEQQTFFSMASSSGLQLRLKLNATTIQSGSALIAQITLFNPLDENLSLLLTSLPSNSNIASWNGYDFVCGGNSMWNLAGYALFRGHYSPDNISSAGEPLMLAPPVADLSCINNTRDLFVFLPDSSHAMVSDSSETGQPATFWNATANATTESCEYMSLSAVGSTHCPVGDSLFGYWSAPSGLASRDATTSSSYFHYFPPGQYTLAVEDIWGQTFYVHFRVTPASSTTTANSITSRTLPCSAPGVQCSSLDVSSVILTAAPAPNQNSTLTAVVTNTGNVDLWQIAFYLNGSLIDTSQGISIGDTVTYNVPIPPSVSIVSGQTYKVDFDSTILLSGGRTEGGGANEMLVTAR